MDGNNCVMQPYESDNDSKQEIVLLALFLYRVLVLKLMFVEVSLPFNLSAIFV